MIGYNLSDSDLVSFIYYDARLIELTNLQQLEYSRSLMSQAQIIGYFLCAGNRYYRLAFYSHLF